MNRYFFFVLALILVTLIFYVKICVEATSWMNRWGIYFLIIPILSFLSIKLTGEQVPIMYTLGALISILLFRGNWMDNYILDKITALLFGTFVSILIYSWMKNKTNWRLL